MYSKQELICITKIVSLKKLFYVMNDCTSRAIGYLTYADVFELMITFFHVSYEYLLGMIDRQLLF